MAAAVGLTAVAVLLNVLVAVDDTDMAVALVEVVNVVAVEPIVIPDIPDIVPMSIPDISMFGFLLVFEMSGRLVFKRCEFWFAGCHPARRADSKLKAEGRSDWIRGWVGAGPFGLLWSTRTKAEDRFLGLDHASKGRFGLLLTKARRSKNGLRQKSQKREREAVGFVAGWGIQVEIQKLEQSSTAGRFA